METMTAAGILHKQIVHLTTSRKGPIGVMIVNLPIPLTNTLHTNVIILMMISTTIIRLIKEIHQEGLCNWFFLYSVRSSKKHKSKNGRSSKRSGGHDYDRPSTDCSDINSYTYSLSLMSELVKHQKPKSSSRSSRSDQQSSKSETPKMNGRSSKKSECTPLEQIKLPPEPKITDVQTDSYSREKAPVAPSPPRRALKCEEDPPPPPPLPSKPIVQDKHP